MMQWVKWDVLIYGKQSSILASGTGRFLIPLISAPIFTLSMLPSSVHWNVIKI